MRKIKIPTKKRTMAFRCSEADERAIIAAANKIKVRPSHIMLMGALDFAANINRKAEAK